MVEKFVAALIHFQLVDLLGMAKLLNVPEQEDFEDEMVEIVSAFAAAPRGKRKELLKLAQQVAENNKEYDKMKEEANNGD